MDRAAALLAAIKAFVGDPQFPVIAGTAILVAAGVLWGRRWYLARTNGNAGSVVAEAFAVVAPYLAGIVILGLALFAAGGKPRPWYETAATLVALLALIRLVTFLLRLSLGKSRSIKTWELRATLIIWAVITAEVLGWLDPVIAELDSIGLTEGKTRITIWSVLKAIATVTVFVVVSVWVARWIDRRISSIKELAPSTRIGIGKFAYAFLIAFGVLFGLQASGVDLTTLTVFSGAIGLGLGFGLQAIAANFVSGFVLLIDRSIKPGDVISFTGTTGTSTTGFGWVEELRGRHVVIRDRDGVATLVPNQNVITNPLINWSYGHPRVRLRLPVRVAYHDDVELALSLLLKAAEHPRILRDPPAVSRLMEFADYGMEVELRFWIGDPAEGVNNVRSDVNRRIWALFRENGISIPPAQHEIRILDGNQTASVLAPRSTQPFSPT
ncbi:MAG TPA: mechanosensitive ion channel domain-containing protein, partial [Steroidobacteraceae bacterium]|nr:mechanosensitive ion channel domain-containing protein [Steroidobacteraceae bacterium]